MRKTSFIVIFLAGIGLLSGCGHLPSVFKDPAARLETRVLKHWDAKTGQNWSEVYSFFCSEYKDKHSRSEFINASKIRILGYELKNIQMESSEDKARVEVEFSAFVRGHELFGLRIQENWIKEDGNWYVCPKSAKNATIFG